MSLPEGAKFSATTLKGRMAIAEDTLSRAESIVASTPGASMDSEFVREEDMPPLTRDDVAHPWPNHPEAPVQIVNSDAFTLARKILQEASDSKVSVLNMASDILPAGPWLQVYDRTQEEALCYTSTLYPTLQHEWYPWKVSVNLNAQGIYSPAVVVFKDDLLHHCADLPASAHIVVSVLTFAAPRGPRTTPDGTRFSLQGDVDAVRAKVQVLLRTAARRGQDTLVLGAIGCGAYGCPPRHVAEIMRDTLKTDEFKGWFRRVEFAVFSRRDPGFLGADNFDIFAEVFQDVTV
ncbi:hypothetical protein BKA62DRAFT_787932 [Auriculariales sp. MPI-PUGE-AT-0066]|nr:hypothetical protein BKA62DRAFT_787932 [Auriculariales sp. MPI-PUGE-AT-0066]